jgi:16S rRNA processing protein RimM
VGVKQQKWVILGRVSGVFGVKGWLKVQSYTEPRDNLAGFGVLTLRLNAADSHFEVEESQSRTGGVAVKLRGIDDRDRAREWVGADVVVERERLPTAGAGEHYWADLEGLEVVDLTGVVLGNVEYLLATGANDVLVLGGSQQRLIPFIVGSVVKQVDLGRGRIVVDWSPDY